MDYVLMNRFSVLVAALISCILAIAFIATFEQPCFAQVAKAKVDAMIDGDGVDVYGALGTGAGGSSTRQINAPGGLDFVFELQNEGGRADHFICTWNTIPGWVATIEGSAPPWYSDVIPPPNTRMFTFHIDVPAGAAPGDYGFVIDVVSNRDSLTVESVEAIVTVLGPPRADLVINGNGLGVFGALGSGQGGGATHAANAGSFYTAALEVWNAGSIPDSFHIDWQVPAGWPAGSILISDGTTDFAAPFWTPVIDGGAFVSYTVKVYVPAGLGPGAFATMIDAYSSLPPNSPESVRLTTHTAAIVYGTVFDDCDHDGSFGAGDAGLPGVTIYENNISSTVQTGGGGTYALWIAGGSAALVIERNPSGFVSVTPDTVSTPILDAGDSLRIDFADVPPLRLTPGVILNGFAGNYVDFPHRIDAGTTGPVSLTATTTDPLVVTMLFLDENGNGVFDGIDRSLQATDLDMDPPAGASSVSILLRVFVPVTYMVGTTFAIDLKATQIITGTPLVSTADAVDAVLVVDDKLGRVTMKKTVDLDLAAPGQVLTYSISFFNSGTDSIQNLVVLDPISPHVDPLPDAFGPGLDVEWTANSGTLYLTLDPFDDDECEYSVSECLLRFLFSKRSPYYLRPGEHGTLTYRAVIK